MRSCTRKQMWNGKEKEKNRKETMWGGLCGGVCLFDSHHFRNMFAKLGTTRAETKNHQNPAAFGSLEIVDDK